MLKISLDKEDESVSVALDTKDEEQLVVETVLLLKEIKKQLMFAEGKEVGLDKFYAILETAKM